MIGGGVQLNHAAYYILLENLFFELAITDVYISTITLVVGFMRWKLPNVQFCNPPIFSIHCLLHSDYDVFFKRYLTTGDSRRDDSQPVGI